MPNTELYSPPPSKLCFSTNFLTTTDENFISPNVQAIILPWSLLLYLVKAEVQVMFQKMLYDVASPFLLLFFNDSAFRKLTSLLFSKHHI